MLDYFNLGFFAFFLIELIAKLLGSGTTQYLKDRFNWFDSAVVGISCIDIILQYTLPSKFFSF